MPEFDFQSLVNSALKKDVIEPIVIHSSDNAVEQVINEKKAFISELNQQTDEMEKLNQIVDVPNPNISSSQEFFNAETISTVELEKRINEDDTIVGLDEKSKFLVSQIRARHNHLKRVLFELKQTELEIASRDRALQYYLQNFASKLRSEVREELKLTDINYTPKIADNTSTKPRAPKMSSEDKLIESYAKAMVLLQLFPGKKWNDISDGDRKECIRRASVLYRNQMKAVSDEKYNPEDKPELRRIE